MSFAYKGLSTNGTLDVASIVKGCTRYRDRTNSSRKSRLVLSELLLSVVQGPLLNFPQFLSYSFEDCILSSEGLWSLAATPFQELR